MRRRRSCGQTRSAESRAALRVTNAEIRADIRNLQKLVEEIRSDDREYRNTANERLRLLEISASTCEQLWELHRGEHASISGSINDLRRDAKVYSSISGFIAAILGGIAAIFNR